MNACYTFAAGIVASRDRGTSINRGSRDAILSGLKEFPTNNFTILEHRDQEIS